MGTKSERRSGEASGCHQPGSAPGQEAGVKSSISGGACVFEPGGEQVQNLEEPPVSRTHTGLEWRKFEQLSQKVRNPVGGIGGQTHSKVDAPSLGCDGEAPPRSPAGCLPFPH